MNNKKYYILYKVVRDAEDNIQDIQYLIETQTQKNIIDYLNCSKRDLQTMINKSFTRTLKTFKDYTIIKE